MPGFTTFQGSQNPDEMKITEAELQTVIDEIKKYMDERKIKMEHLDLGGAMSHRAARKIMDRITEDPGYTKIAALVRACGGRLVLVRCQCAIW